MWVRGSRRKAREGACAVLEPGRVVGAHPLHSRLGVGPLGRSWGCDAGSRRTMTLKLHET